MRQDQSSGRHRREEPIIEDEVPLFDDTASHHGIPSPLVPFLAKNAAIGFGMAILFVAAILIFDVGNVATLVSQSSFGVFAVALTTFMVGLTFAGLQMGLAVMTRNDEMGASQDTSKQR
ncbi:MAG: hypothetical protein AAF590_02560 [Pseudomonadota bacterium]